MINDTSKIMLQTALEGSKTKRETQASCLQEQCHFLHTALSLCLLLIFTSRAHCYEGGKEINNWGTQKEVGITWTFLHYLLQPES